MRIQLGKIFDDEKRLLLLETGALAIEKLLQDEADRTQAEIKTKRAKLEELKAKNQDAANKIRQSNTEILGRNIINIRPRGPNR